MEGEIGGGERGKGKRKTRKSRKKVGGRVAMTVQTRCVKPTRHMTKDTIVNCGE